MLQRNQIYCMDALDLLRALDPQSVDMVLCDLPYNVTQNVWDSIIPLEPMWKELARVIKANGAIVLTAMQPFTSMLVSTNYKMFRYEWIWYKTRATNFLNASKMPMRDHENILVFGHKMPVYYPQGETRETPLSVSVGLRPSPSYGDFQGYEKTYDTYTPRTVLTIPHEPEMSVTKAHRPDKLEMHPTQKPVALFEYLIKTYTQEGELVVDMTCGSGTTAIAARKWGRDFICGDNSAEYVDMARHRLATSDPYQDKPMKDGRKQLSLFSAEFDKRGEP